MKTNFKLLFILLTTVCCLSVNATDTLPEWQSQYAIGLNKITPHSYIWPYATKQAVIERDHESSPWYQSLNGSWKFHWVKNPDNRPKEFYKPSFYVDNWAEINVPGNWERQGYGTAIYVNETYEFDDPMFNFKKNPPLVPHDENEVGSYRRTFTIPASWKNRRIVLCCEGVISFFYVWINGEFIGYNQGSKTPAEWDITDKLQEGENTIALEVYRWSAGSYLECQDMWRLSGIERDVYLYSTPKTYIADYKVTSSLDKETYTNGIFGLEVLVDGNKDATVAYELLDENNTPLLSGHLNNNEKNDKGWYVLPDKVLKNIRTWNAEHPNLYTLILSLQSAEEKDTQLTGCHVGFRTSEIKNGRFHVNGVPIIIKGANRHEHSQSGRTVSKELMLKDIALMKQYNLNTVRNSHYPTHPYWYELCNQYGLYVIDEANIESHGMGYGPASLAKDTTWLPAHTDRIVRMYERSKNHPSIVIWSLGNEAGNGVNFEKTYDWMKSVEKSRPVQYERAEQNYNTDIYCRMYRSVEELLAYARQEEPKVYRPFIMTEYLHAMGNSGGGLKEYMNVFETEPIVQGGCIWDWVDQSFREIDSDGKWYWTYGGDYGPKGIPSFDNFCCNGLVSADRKPHPHLLEVKKAYQYIKAKLMDTNNLQLSVKNWYDFTDLHHYTLYWEIIGDNGEVIANGNRTVDCAPHQTVEVKLGKVNLPRDIREAFLNLSWRPKESYLLIDNNHEVAYDQFILPANKNYQGNKEKETNKVTLEFDKESGALTSYRFNNEELLSSPVMLSLYRPVTDNDNREKQGGAKVWQALGLDNLTQRAVKMNTGKNGGTSEVEIINANNDKIGIATYKYSLKKSGELIVDVKFKPDTSLINHLVAKLGRNQIATFARVGLGFEIPYDFNKVNYLGRGEHETYSDRNQSGLIGLYDTDVERMFHYYVKPQSTGNRTDVRWVKLTNESGAGVKIDSDKNFQFSVIPFTNKNLDEAKHINELKRNGTITVHLDAEQSGVGTATCGPGVLPPYRIDVKDYSFRFSIIPIKNIR